MNLDCYLKRDRKILHLRHFDGSQPVARQIRLSSRANRKILRRFFGQHRSERGTIQPRVKYWEIIADNLSEAGWSWGCVSAIDSNWRTIWIVDAHRGDGKRYVLRADEKLTALLGRFKNIWRF